LKSIVAAFDLSPLARRVADRARMIAEETGATLDLVHVAETPDMPLPDDMLERLYLRRHSQAEELSTWINSRATDHVNLRLLRGRVGTELTRLSKKADLIVTGTSSIDAARIGPRATRIARKGHAPVLAVRRQPRVPYRRVLAAVDLSEASKTAVELARQIAPGAEVSAVVALPTNAEQLLADAGVNLSELAKLRVSRMAQLEELAEEFVEEWNGEVAIRVVDGPPTSVIGEQARRRNVDLVTVSSRGAGGSQMVLLGSVAEALLSSVPADVAVARVPGAFRRP
jgi:nucleotide-binding universal stress UspA family protein